MGRAGKVSTREREVLVVRVVVVVVLHLRKPSATRASRPSPRDGSGPTSCRGTCGVRARARKKKDVVDRKERERERERERVSFGSWPPPRRAQPSPVAAAAPGARERTKQTTYHVVKTLAICANKKERSAATRGLGARATSTRLMMWPGGSSSANRSEQGTTKTDSTACGALGLPAA